MKTNAQPTIERMAEPNVKPLNGARVKTSQASEKLEKQRQAAADAIAAAEAQLQLIADEEQQEAAAEYARLNETRNGMLLDAENYRTLAKRETDEEEKKLLLKFAMNEEQRAYLIGLEMGIDPSNMHYPEHEADRPVMPWLKRNLSLVAVLQVSAILAFVAYCYAKFNSLHDQIVEGNKTLDPGMQVQAYDVTSIQKFFFEKLVVFTDLPIALVMLFLIVPFVGFYVLPFLRSKRDFYTEFNEELTAWQRTLITTAWGIGLLLFLALSHLVKP